MFSMSPPSYRRSQSLLDSLGETPSQRNALLLVQLRWLAVFGQAFTIVVSSALFNLSLPLAPMFCVIGGLVLWNTATMLRPHRGAEADHRDLFIGLVLDFSALTALLYFSGGATNPFASLYLLQVVLGAILLEAWAAWILVGLTCVAFAVLTVWHVPLQLPATDADRSLLLFVLGGFICFVLNALLLVLFVNRIHLNLLKRDQHLAALRQQAAEEDHIVRMGLLASGAAHELGTPLSTLSVILGDWQRLPALQQPELQQDIQEMQSAVLRCKGIVGGILISAGEARGESPVVTTLARFMVDLITEWRRLWPALEIDYRVEEPVDLAALQRLPVVSDSALRQVIVNVLDNAREVSPHWLGLSLSCRDDLTRLTVRDRGPGFAPEMLARLGKPYHSTKDRPGSGLGLFLVFNVLRKLGGQVFARNAEGGGAEVTLEIPLRSLALPATESTP